MNSVPPAKPVPDIDIAQLRMRAGEVSGLLKLLANPGRLLIACELMEGERTVSQIEQRTGVRQPNLSRDLARLRAAGLVAARRDGKTVHYRLKDARITLLMGALCAAFASDLKSPPAAQTHKD
ncbi:winged helix-turn-helix transcriptional regulator [Alkalicaulis satelles]|uniref:Winged helix-turn-helix transcriptional regulator n=1 Tax=Alkalicaulis satelles TaxID=2609175 RepID=A0A5M6ZGN4_9PROT|nr:metalloregulator ArsR/SmtB family transcription factor [Alkalicaulis satelles]KAA5803889.1 winged helix-turn-helix transcriptional regulator [Alkalicaulis satelles]